MYCRIGWSALLLLKNEHSWRARLCIMYAYCRWHNVSIKIKPYALNDSANVKTPFKLTCLQSASPSPENSNQIIFGWIFACVQKCRYAYQVEYHARNQQIVNEQIVLKTYTSHNRATTTWNTNNNNLNMWFLIWIKLKAWKFIFGGADCLALKCNMKS